MNFEHFKKIMRNRDKHLRLYNSADGTTTDTSTDAVITRDPNSYLVPRIDIVGIKNTLIMIALIAAVIVLIPMAIKTIKQYT